MIHCTHARALPRRVRRRRARCCPGHLLPGVLAARRWDTDLHFLVEAGWLIVADDRASGGCRCLLAGTSHRRVIRPGSGLGITGEEIVLAGNGQAGQYSKASKNDGDPGRCAAPQDGKGGRGDVSRRRAEPGPQPCGRSGDSDQYQRGSHGLPACHSADDSVQRRVGGGIHVRVSPAEAVGRQCAAPDATAA
jgi:hypothetical protein